jgi:hypothetical protein
VNETEYVEPTARARRLALALFVLGLGAMFGLHLAWPLLMGHIRALPVCEQLRWFRGLVALQAVLMALIPAALLGIAVKVQRAQRWPPPGLLVLRRMKLLRGAAAQRRAAWLTAAGVLAGLLVAALVTLLVRLIINIGSRWQCGVG